MPNASASAAIAVPIIQRMIRVSMAFMFDWRVPPMAFINIETEFRYGLSKGAVGTLLDQSG
jgi:hypothetical protein